MPAESPDDWLITVRYQDQRHRDRLRTICVAPLYRADEHWHRTTEEYAIERALWHIVWGVVDIPYKGRTYTHKRRLGRVPEAVISITTRRRHEPSRAWQDACAMRDMIAGRFA